jgi:Spy/CpxP family protein refolding chaperone
MNRWIRRVVTVASIAGSLALLPGAVAFAQQAPQGQQEGHGRAHHGGLLRDALKLDSLSSEQRTQIDGLVQGHRTAEVPVRQASAQLLTKLATQVEAAKIDRPALEDTLNAEAAAAKNARGVEVGALTQLHNILTAAQRNQIVDTIAGRLPQGRSVPAALDAFRGDSFDANAVVREGDRGEHLVSHLESKVPGMSADQRADLASHLRARAARESKT